MPLWTVEAPKRVGSNEIVVHPSFGKLPHILVRVQMVSSEKHNQPSTAPYPAPQMDLYRNMTIKDLIRTMEKLRTQVVDGRRILFPRTKREKQIYAAFGISPPL